METRRSNPRTELDPRRATAFAIVFFAAAMLATAARANGVPMPVDPGQLYVEANLGYGQMRSDSSSLLRTYVDDSAATGGTVTLTDSQGFLASFDTTDEGWTLIPGVTLGFATKSPWFGGALGSVTRLELSAEYYERQATFAIDTLPIPSTGYTIDVGGTPTDTGLVVHMGPIDGTVFDDMGNALSGSVVSGSVGMDPLLVVPTDAITMSMSETTGNGQMMVWFDEPKGSWVFSRGAGINVGYTKASYAYAVPFRALSSVAGGQYEDPATGVARHDYDFDLDAYFVGANAAFSIGYRPIKYFTVFWNGSFAPMVNVSRIQGSQYGFCLADCSTTGGYTTVKLDARDLNFAYDARTAAGLSLLFYKFIRVTGQVGVFANNQTPQPYEGSDGDRFGTKLRNMWGYYGRASVMLSF